MLSPDHDTYMDIHQAINFGILRGFQREGIEFAFPTRTLYLPGLTEAVSASAAPEAQRLQASAGAK